MNELEIKLFKPMDESKRILLDSMGLENIYYYTLYVQPIVSLQYDSLIKKFEFLFRAFDKFDKVISPLEIFSEKRTHEDLKKLDLLVFENAMSLLSINKDSLCDAYMASINVSEASIEDSSEYLDNIEQIRIDYGIEPKNICLELTEKAYDGIGEFTNKSLLLKYFLAVDDFGSKHSATGLVLHGLLNSIPEGMADHIIVKLDMFYVKNLDNSTVIYSDIIRGVYHTFLGFKKYKGLKLVAEGARDLESTMGLKSNRVDFVQSFFTGEPMEFNENYKQPIYSKKVPQLSFDFE
ncbi:MAG: EAL domain-containing protein [Nanoarchaeales archaeon]|nr:EAL domain-containing protein [Nanoarchaeales archaeon]